MRTGAAIALWVVVVATEVVVMGALFAMRVVENCSPDSTYWACSGALEVVLGVTAFLVPLLALVLWAASVSRDSEGPPR